jgi:hypothetical protein
MAAGDGLIVMTPTSINVTGTSGSINADGGVDFTAVTALSLNGVFTSSFDNYVVTFRGTDAATLARIDSRLRLSGTDATATNYTIQRIFAQSTSVSGERATSQSYACGGYASSTAMSGWTLHVYGPALAQPTAFRSVEVDGYNSAELIDQAATHSLSTSYDGITFLGGTMTGAITVFGYEE